LNILNFFRRLNLKDVKGKEGEKIAEEFLKKKGYSLLERNFRVKGGEIDLLMKSGSKIVAVEVKLRTTKKFGEPYESVTNRKLKRIKLALIIYLRKRNYSLSNAQIDVLSIFKDKNKTEIRHFENVGMQ
jgi:putative endonuclease